MQRTNNEGQLDFEFLPPEIILLMLQHSTAIDVLSFMLASKKMQTLAADDAIWQRYGAENYADFFTRLKNLPASGQNSILKYGFSFKEYAELAKILKISDPNKIPPEWQEKIYRHIPLLEKFKDPMNVFRALLENRITLDQIAVLSNDAQVKFASRPSGQKIIREGLLTLKQVSELNADSLNALNTPMGYDALKNKIITFEQVKIAEEKEFSFLLACMFGFENSRLEDLPFYKLMKDGIITFDQVCNTAKPIYFGYICSNIDGSGVSDHCAQALRSQILSLDAMQDLLRRPDKPDHWHILFSDTFIKAYKNGLINFEMAYAEAKEKNGIPLYLKTSYEVFENLSANEVKNLDKIWKSHADDKSKMIALLKDYTKGGKLGRFATLHWNTHYADNITKIINESRNDSAEQLLKKVDNFLDHNLSGSQYNNSKLKKTICYIHVKIMQDKYNKSLNNPVNIEESNTNIRPRK